MNLQRCWTRLGVLALTGAMMYWSAAAIATPVTNGLALWLDATDPSTLFQDSALTIPAGAGDLVGGWKDKSGNNFHATTAAEKRPVYGADFMNGEPALRFSAAEQDGMLIDPALQVFRPFTAFIVNQYSGPVRGRTLQGTSPNNWLLGLWAGNFGHYADGWVSLIRPATPGHVFIADAVDDFGQSSFFLNGVNLTTNDTPIGEPGNLALTGAGTWAEYSDADISEILVYDRALNQNELGQVRQYLYDKYSVNPRGPKNTVYFGSLSVFTGGDAGEGLDLDGTFQYAVNFAGPGGLKVRDAVFSNDSAPGVQVQSEFIDGGWFARPDMGDTVNDENLETVLHSIRWTAYNGNALDTIPIRLDGVIPGADYKLQLLFAERCCDRAYNIVIDGAKAVETLHVPSLTGTPEDPLFSSLDKGVVYTHSFKATRDTLSIELDGRFSWFPDGNPLIQALTLEVSLPKRGDFNFDGQIDLSDFDILLAGFAHGDNYTEGDYNLDGTVDFKDFRAFKAAFQGQGASAAPEPAAWLLLSLGAAGLGFPLRRRRRMRATTPVHADRI